MHNLAVALDPCRRLLGNHLSPPFPRPRLVPKRAARPNAEGLTQAARLDWVAGPLQAAGIRAETALEGVELHLQGLAQGGHSPATVGDPAARERLQGGLLLFAGWQHLEDLAIYGPRVLDNLKASLVRCDPPELPRGLPPEERARLVNVARHRIGQLSPIHQLGTARAQGSYTTLETIHTFRLLLQAVPNEQGLLLEAAGARQKPYARCLKTLQESSDRLLRELRSKEVAPETLGGVVLGVLSGASWLCRSVLPIGGQAATRGLQAKAQLQAARELNALLAEAIEASSTEERLATFVRDRLSV